MSLSDEDLHRELAEAIRETENGGILVRLDWGKDVWLPQRRIHHSSEVQHEGDEGELVIPYDLAVEKGIV